MSEKILKLKRYEKNPIMLPRGDSWESAHVSNPAATVFDNKVYLIYRAEGKDLRRGPGSWPVTRLGLAISENGFDISERYDLPVFDKSETDPWCEFGCEDPRISKIGDTYYIVYVSMSRFGHFGDRLALASTKDFKTFERHGLLMDELEQRTSGLLPEKINGEFVLFHRPMPNMWLSRSADLKSWHDYRCIFKTVPGTWYENKLGIGAPPIKTPYGWFLVWHGKNNNCEYALSAMLLDLNDPGKILKVQTEPMLKPEMDYEREGFVNNVVYTNGVVEFNGKLFVYYGCCDLSLSVGTLEMDDVYAWCRDI